MNDLQSAVDKVKITMSEMPQSSEKVGGLMDRCDKLERLLYDFRQECFKGIYETEQIFDAKNDVLRREIAGLRM